MPTDTASPDGGCRDQFGQQVGTRDGAEDDDADEHGQAACGGDQQRLNGGLAAGGAFGVVTDQQEGQHGGELPEHVEHQHVVADHQPEHGAGERDQLRGETRQPFLGVTVVVVEVVGAVEQHQRADAKHEHAHDRRERVEPQRDVHRQLRHPRHRDAAGLARSRPVQRHPDQGSERDERQRIERLPPPPVHQQRSRRGGDRVGEEDGEHGAEPAVYVGGCSYHPARGYVRRGGGRRRTDRADAGSGTRARRRRRPAARRARRHAQHHQGVRRARAHARAARRARDGRRAADARDTGLRDRAARRGHDEPA